jgi:flap endonuclease-1
MGIKQLTKLIQEFAPAACKEQGLGDYNGRKIAIDASMAIYQFLVAVRSSGDGTNPSAQLMNEAGEVTSHLQGMFYRTLKFIENGIKPAYVFDGKPPTLKSGEVS